MPLSILSNFGKVIEMFFFFQRLSLPVKCALIPEQPGFGGSKSTITNLVNLSLFMVPLMIEVKWTECHLHCSRKLYSLLL